MKKARTERELEAVFEFECKKRGAQRMPYPAVVASGGNACTLHYIDNFGDLRPDVLVLIDAGAEYMMYSSDISRSFPVSGRFSPVQRDVYSAVLSIQEDILKVLSFSLSLIFLPPPLSYYVRRKYAFGSYFVFLHAEISMILSFIYYPLHVR